MTEDPRPRTGTVTRAGGEIIDVRYIEDTPGVFRAIDLDGQPVEVHHGDTVHADLLGPGQSLALSLVAELPQPGIDL